MIINQTQFTENSIRTYTGKSFDLKLMHPDSISIEDIAHALSHTSRYAGHLEQHYSVAQHSVLIAQHVSNKNRLAALLHDGSEAYLGDMPSPFKKMMPEFRAFEDKLMQVIAQKFGFEFPLHPEIKEWDHNFLNIEIESFIEGSNILDYWSPEKSEQRFLEMFEGLRIKNHK